jgi:hypothetical protein
MVYIYEDIKNLFKTYLLSSLQVKSYTSLCQKNFGGSLLSKENALKNKTSEKIYILGCGSSINSLTEKQIRTINMNDSIGINSWALHPKIVPKYYSYEAVLLKDIDENTSAINQEKKIIYAINSQWNKYCETLFIVKPRIPIQKEVIDLLAKMESRGNLYWNNYSLIPGVRRSTFSFFLRLYYNLGLLKSNRYFVNKAASVIWCLGFAFKLGYKEIILTGVDLYGNYFHDSSKVNSLESSVAVNLHGTADVEKVHDGITIMDLIDVWNQVVLKPSGVKLFISHESSLLSRYLPVGGLS